MCPSESQTRFLTAKSFDSATLKLPREPKASSMANLKLRQHSLSTTNRDLTAGLLLRIYDRAVVDDHRVTRGALAIGPA